MRGMEMGKHISKCDATFPTFNYISLALYRNIRMSCDDAWRAWRFNDFKTNVFDFSVVPLLSLSHCCHHYYVCHQKLFLRSFFPFFLSQLENHLSVNNCFMPLKAILNVLYAPQELLNLIEIYTFRNFARINISSRSICSLSQQQ